MWKKDETAHIYMRGFLYVLTKEELFSVKYL